MKNDDDNDDKFGRAWHDGIVTALRTLGFITTILCGMFLAALLFGPWLGPFLAVVFWSRTGG